MQSMSGRPDIAAALGSMSPSAVPPLPAEESSADFDFQPVLSLLTQGVNVHATRLDAVARVIQRLERSLKESEAKQAESEVRIAEAFARAEAAEQAADARIAASEARAAATTAGLERKLSELEARIDVMPAAFEELRGRSAQLEHTCGQHERELSARSAEIAENREAHAVLAGRVDGCALSSALAAAEAALHSGDAQLREELAETNAKQRRVAMQANGLQEGHAQMHGLLSEQQVIPMRSASPTLGHLADGGCALAHLLVLCSNIRLRGTGGHQLTPKGACRRSGDGSGDEQPCGGACGVTPRDGQRASSADRHCSARARTCSGVG